jgi:hypothetical protein
VAAVRTIDVKIVGDLGPLREAIARANAECRNLRCEVATEATVLNEARDLYVANPAHGLPHVTNRATGDRSQCVISAICTAGFALGAPQLIKSACNHMKEYASCGTVARLAEWEAAADTDEVRDAFVAVAGGLS